MTTCLKRIEGKNHVDVQPGDLEEVLRRIADQVTDNVARRLLQRVIVEASVCSFATLANLVAHLKPSYKTQLKDVLFRANLALWNPEKRCEFRFWE